jgi:hypothetical protein
MTGSSISPEVRRAIPAEFPSLLFPFSTENGTANAIVIGSIEGKHTSRSTDESSSDVLVVLVHGTDIAGVVVVVKDLLVVLSDGDDGGDAGGNEFRSDGSGDGKECAEHCYL